MLKTSKASFYAIKSLAYLAKSNHEGFLKIEEISRKSKISENYLRKIFQFLTKKGIVLSAVGPRGGVKINPAALNINIGNIIEMFDGVSRDNHCIIFGHQECPLGSDCPIYSECLHIRNTTLKKLLSFSLEELAK